MLWYNIRRKGATEQNGFDRVSRHGEASPIGVGRAMLSTHGLMVGHGRTAVAHVPDVQIGAGETLVLLGPSGSGKSTALFTLAGLLTPAAGEARLEGRTIGPDRESRRRTGLVFQDMHLLPGLTVLDNLLLAPFAVGLRQDRDEAKRLLDLLGVGGLATRRAETLSRGEAQRVAIGRAMLLRPALILADEPTASLDDAAADSVSALLQTAVAETGAALVIATHDHRLKARFGNHLSLLPARAEAA